VGLYVHVPFCRTICTYCAFAKGEYETSLADLWLSALDREVAVRGQSSWTGKPLLDTVFLGGGTPSALTPVQWHRLGNILRAGFEFAPNLEFTSEANPESTTPDAVEAMRQAGVNRLSLGVQSLNVDELAMLGRIHGADEVRSAVSVAREAGMGNLNLDVMYALPGQTETSFHATVEGVLELGPDHISAYCLGLEPGTTLAARVDREELPKPKDETARNLYEFLAARLAESGYPLYEISNFARDGRLCRHNLRYWTRSDVIALGPSAHGLLADHRWVNPAPLPQWIDAYSPDGIVPEPKPVPPELARFEWVFLHLRLSQGLSKSAFADRWGDSFDDVHGGVSGRLADAGFLIETAERVRLSPEARFVSDAVFAEFAPNR
jgi:oxygen-independent coproporphyrinogen-3 oxidase